MTDLAQRDVPHANQVNNTMSKFNNNHAFEILTDEQIVALMYAGLYTAQTPVRSVNDMLHSTVPRIIPPNEYFTSGDVNLRPIRNLYLISNNFGTHNSIRVHGEWGILEKIPVNSDDNQLIYDQTVLGMAYLDCSNQTLSLIDFKIKGPRREYR